MPRNAMDNVPLHFCLPVTEIARVLVDLTAGQPQAFDMSGSRPARLLIVEDELIVAHNLVSRLRDLGYLRRRLGLDGRGRDCRRVGRDARPRPDGCLTRRNDARYRSRRAPVAA